MAAPKLINCGYQSKNPQEGQLGLGLVCKFERGCGYWDAKHCAVNWVRFATPIVRVEAHGTSAFLSLGR